MMVALIFQLFVSAKSGAIHPSC